VDFGLSTFLKNPSAVFESELTTPCGTLEYTAPEIIKKEKYDPYASDVWSLGVVLYCIVSGSTHV
jgi:serine/threonine protein kinase